jgi:hypothetical protein
MVQRAQRRLQHPDHGIAPIFVFVRSPDNERRRAKMAIPEYARNVTPHRRVRILCRGACEVPRHAEASKDNWFKTEDAVKTGLYATCLKCGYQARDNYNWDRLNS